MIEFEANNNITDVLKELSKFEDVIKNKAIRSGLVSLSNPVKKSMKANAPNDSGDLAESINHKSLNDRQKSRLNIDNNDVAIVVGPNKKVDGRNVNWRANFIEEGVKSHDINVKKTGALKRLKLGEKIISGPVIHPGIKANPFMSKAIQSNESNFEALFYKGLARSLKRVRSQ